MVVGLVLGGFVASSLTAFDDERIGAAYVIWTTVAVTVALGGWWLLYRRA